MVDIMVEKEQIEHILVMFMQQAVAVVDILVDIMVEMVQTAVAVVELVHLVLDGTHLRVLD